jgi:hypothetical protein
MLSVMSPPSEGYTAAICQFSQVWPNSRRRPKWKLGGPLRQPFPRLPWAVALGWKAGAGWTVVAGLPHSRGLIHTETWAGSRAWSTTLARSSRTESRSTVFF